MAMRLEDLPPQAREQVTRKMLASGKKSPAGTKESKYHNRKDTRTMPDGTVITFDSIKEARRFDELILLRKARRIRELRLQVEFTLREAYTTAEGYRVRAIRYKADFTYLDESGNLIVEDTKTRPTKTKEYAIKKKLMLEKFNLQIREV